MNYIVLSLLCFNIFCFASSHIPKAHHKKRALYHFFWQKVKQEKRRQHSDLIQPKDAQAKLAERAEPLARLRRLHEEATSREQRKIEHLDYKILSASLCAESYRLEHMLLEEELKAEQKFYQSLNHNTLTTNLHAESLRLEHMLLEEESKEEQKLREVAERPEDETEYS